MQTKVHWGAVGISVLNWIAGGTLAAIVPAKYKEIALAASALAQALIPSIVHKEDAP